MSLMSDKYKVQDLHEQQRNTVSYLLLYLWPTQSAKLAFTATGPDKERPSN